MHDVAALAEISTLSIGRRSEAEKPKDETSRQRHTKIKTLSQATEQQREQSKDTDGATRPVCWLRSRPCKCWQERRSHCPAHRRSSVWHHCLDWPEDVQLPLHLHCRNPLRGSSNGYCVPTKSKLVSNYLRWSYTLHRSLQMHTCLQNRKKKMRTVCKWTKK